MTVLLPLGTDSEELLITQCLPSTWALCGLFSLDISHLFKNKSLFRLSENPKRNAEFLSFGSVMFPGSKRMYPWLPGLWKLLRSREVFE